MRKLRHVRSLFVSLLAGASLAGCTDLFSQSADQAKPKAADRPVLVAKVSYQPLRPDIVLVAIIRPRVESDLSFRVGGKVAQRLVEIGQTVAPGTPLARLDTTDLSLQRDQAEAELRAAKSALAQVEADSHRMQALRKQGWSTQANLDRQNALLAESKGRVERAEKAVALATNALGYATLTADAPGIVTAALVEPGQVVAAGTPVIRLARPEEKEAAAAVPEIYLAHVRAGKATVSLWARPDKRYNAALRELSPVADPTARTYAARFTIENPSADIALGMSATVTIGEADSLKVARLPLAALSDTGKGPGLFVVDRASGRVSWKAIVVAGYESGHVLVRSGVEEGEWVAALGVHKLDPDQIVRAVDQLQF